MKKQRHAHAWILGLSALALVSGCKGCGESTEANKAAAPVPQVPARALQARDKVMPMELMADSTSPYVSGLFVDDQAVYLTTDKMAYRVVPGGKPQRIPVENGATAGLTSTDLVYWGQNALWKVPKLGGQAQRLVDLKLQPAYLAAFGDDFAWAVVPTTGKFEIQTIENQKVRTLYFNSGRLETLTMGPGRVYFVEKDGQDPWRLGSVSVRGGDLKFAPPKSGPSPAKLAFEGEVYHYDLNSGEIRKIAADLSREEVIANKTICSPIAVAQKIYCPNMEGLWQLERQPGAQTESVFPEPRRITNVAANAKFITWLADTGPDRLSLMLLPLP
jgi:hypothetical protein